MARKCSSCHIFKSSLLLSYKPNWEIVCIRYGAQQTNLKSEELSHLSLKTGPKEKEEEGACFKNMGYGEPENINERV